MSKGCSDICDMVLDIMCSGCPNYNKRCMSDDEETNYYQMLTCMRFMQERINGQFPAESELEYPYH